MQNISLFILCAMLALLPACSPAASDGDKVIKDEAEPTAPNPLRPQAGANATDGRVIDTTMDTLTIETDDGRTLTFDTSRADKFRVGDILPGDIFRVSHAELSQGITPATGLKRLKTRAQAVIDDMSTEEKIGQLFLARCPEDSYLDAALSLHPGGFVLFKRDFADRTKEQVVDRIQSFNRDDSVPLIVAVDEEGGTVVRISSNPKLCPEPFKSPQELYSSGGMEAVFEDATAKADLLLSLGVNLNLAPVADISQKPQDYIYPRAFGLDAESTASYVQTVVNAMEEKGLSSCLKHFPGYGGNADTHTGLTLDSREYAEFTEGDFLPFAAGIKSGAPCVLISHNIVKSMDGDRPASLSLSVHEILRKELGFEGVIMTDDVSMGAIAQYSGGESPAVAAVGAGNDMIITSDFQRDYESVLDALQDGSISQTQLNGALNRIIEWKYRYGIIK